MHASLPLAVKQHVSEWQEARSTFVAVHCMLQDLFSAHLDSSALKIYLHALIVNDVDM